MTFAMQRTDNRRDNHLRSLTPCQLLLEPKVLRNTLVSDARGMVPKTSGTNHVDKYFLAITPRLYTRTSYRRVQLNK